MAERKFGSGIQRCVRISVEGGKIRKTTARINVFGSRLVIFESPDLAGKIGIPYWANQLVQTVLNNTIDRKQGRLYSFNTLLFQVYPDIYSALRRTLHILYCNYGRSFRTQGEKKELQAALDILQKVNQYYLRLKKVNVDKYQNGIQAQIEAMFQRISQQPRDEKKREARDLMKLVGDIFDSRGQVNPSAKLSRVVAIRNRLNDRISDILRIEPRIIEQRQTLIAIIELCELRFRLVEDFLNRLYPHLEAEYFASHGGADLSRRVAYRLQNLADEITEIDVRPFLTPGQRIDMELDQAAELIMANDFVGAKKLVTTSRESLKLRVLRTDIENFITRLTRFLFSPQRRLPASEIERIKKALRNIRARLAKIDERGFRHPVCRHALSLVSQAEQPVRHLLVARNFALKPVKEKLVEAARLL